MGWLYKYGFTAKDIKADLLAQLGDKAVDHGGSGREFYILIKVPVSDQVADAGDGMGRVILVNLIQSGGSDGYGYKDMDEACGPYYFNCPERILAASTCQNKTAIEWREKCREHRNNGNAVRTLVRNLSEGDVVKTTVSGTVKFLRFYNDAKTAFVGKTEDGSIYRYNLRHVSLK